MKSTTSLRPIERQDFLLLVAISIFTTGNRWCHFGGASECIGGWHE
jgi:hypothetical protein